jgi:predicted acylesterase/phospholipase RssA
MNDSSHKSHGETGCHENHDSNGRLSQGPVRIGVVLSSGGGRGVYAHTGFLLALEALGIEIAAVAGCSAGALVGGIYASGTDLHQWTEAIASARSRDYWTPDAWPRFFWNMIVRKGRGYSGFSDTQAAIEFIRHNLTATRFEQCQIPFYSLAMNLTRGVKTLFSEGELAPRIMASAAMPVLYRPVEINGDLYSDGALIELSPTDAVCCKHGLDALIIHHTAMHREGTDGLAWAQKQPWTLVGILYLLLYRQRPWYLSGQALSFTHCLCGCGAPIIVIEPDLPELSWPLSIGGVEIQAAAMEQTLGLLKPYLTTLKTAPHHLFDSPTIIHQGQVKNGSEEE